MIFFRVPRGKSAAAKIARGSALVARRAPVEEKRISAEELARSKIDYPCELVEGRVVRMSPAGGHHGRVLGRIIAKLAVFVARKKCGDILSGETGFLVRSDPDTVRAPDTAYVSWATIDLFEQSGKTYFPVAPDLAVEVLSPDDTWEALEKKAREYLDGGSKLVWVVNPKSETVWIFERGSSSRSLGVKNTIDGGKALPGFKAKVARFFRDER